MGAEKQQTQGNTTINQTSTPTMTPEERVSLDRQNRIAAASEADQIQMNKNAAANVNTLLTGGQLPGNLGMLSSGLSQAWQNNAANTAVNQANATLNASGIFDAGSAQVARARTAGDIYNTAGQFNIQTLQQLLNQGIGGQAQVQQPMLANQSMLSNSLSGLRSINTQGTTSSTSTLTMMNPFLKSFQNQLGSTMGGSQFRFNV